MNEIVTGIIGDGTAASCHAHEINISSSFSLLALAPGNQKKGRQLGLSHHIAYIDKDPEYLLERDEIDAVVIALPTEKHGEYIKYVTSYSKIALSESPLSLSPKECTDILRLVQNGEYVFYANPYLYLPFLENISSSFHTFSLEFSSISMKTEETLQIALEVLIRLFGHPVSISPSDNGCAYYARFERGEGMLECSFASDLNGLTLIVDGERVIDGLLYYDALPHFYSFVYSALERGSEIESVLETALEAALLREKILPSGNILI